MESFSAILIEAAPPILFNQYDIILVNLGKHPNVKADQGQPFVGRALHKEGQAAIADYKVGGQQLFAPNAKIT